MKRPIGIIGAMGEEVEALTAQLTETKIEKLNGLVFHQGLLKGAPAIIVCCGIGKVNAAMCTQILLTKFNPWAVVNSGVAGGIAPQVKIGDIVISEQAVHHDFDTVAFGTKPGQIPRMAESFFPANPPMVEAAYQLAQERLGAHRVHVGVVASGDQFIASAQRKAEIYQTFRALCAEMEGAAVAHVCHLNNVPYIIIRAISDQADNQAPDNFQQFIRDIVPELNAIVMDLANHSVCSNSRR